MLEVRGWVHGGRLTASAKTAKEAFALAVEWQTAKSASDVTICDGSNCFTVAEFSWMIASREINQEERPGRRSPLQRRVH